MFNSRTISFLLSLIVAVVTTSFLLLFNVSSVSVIAITFVMSFVSSFLVFFLTLELLVYRDLRKLYKLFARISGEKKNFKNKSGVSVREIGKKLFQFANTKQKENEKLKKLESFRREFLADISHELKTPVFAAQGFIHTLLDGAIDDKSVRKKFLKKAGKSLDGLNILVQDLITISQMETGEVIMQEDDFDIYQLTMDIIDQLETKLQKKDISISVNGEPGEFVVSADYYRINQVLTNLIDNAIKYGNSPGKILVFFVNDGTRVNVTIKDDGPGILEEHQSRIFQRFYRVDKSRSRVKGGTGLGLSIVKHIIESHNSKIQLQSKSGEGTTFMFSLKASQEQE